MLPTATKKTGIVSFTEACYCTILLEEGWWGFDTEVGIGMQDSDGWLFFF
jgi:hypothetical protein